jgi:hypothetical protein
MRVCFSSIVFCIVSFTAMAKTEIQTPLYGGSGCEAGTIEPFWGSDPDTIYFTTPDYRAEIGKRKTCMLVLPVQPEPKTRVAITSVRVKTSSFLPEDSTGVFQAELFMAGLRTPAMNIIFEGPLEKSDINVLMPDENRLIWSGCGQSANLRVNSSLTATEGAVQVVSLRIGLKTIPC